MLNMPATSQEKINPVYMKFIISLITSIVGTYMQMFHVAIHYKISKLISELFRTTFHIVKITLQMP